MLYRFYFIIMPPLDPAFEEMPRYPDENRVHEAITRYRVLDTCDTGSFVSLQSFSHVKHQVRVHAEKIIQSPIVRTYTPFSLLTRVADWRL